MCPGTRSTRGSRRAASSSTIRRTRTTGSTAARRTAGCASPSAGTTLVDTTDTMIVFETALEPRLYVDPSVVRTDLLRRSETQQLLQLQGLRDVLVGGGRRHRRRRRRRGATTDPLPETLPIKGYFSFDAARAEVLAEVAGIGQGARLRLRSVTPVTVGAGDLVPYGCVTVGSAGYGCVRFPCSATLPAVC